MKPTNLGLCALLSFFALQTPASAQIPRTMIAYTCGADCFSVGGDGNTLYYAGHNTTGLYWNKDRAYDLLKAQCGGNGISVVRKLLSMAPQDTVTNYSDTSSSSTTTYRDSCYWSLRYVSSSSNSHTANYQVINHEMRAVFDATEANEDNACRPKSIYSRPIYTTSGGDVVLN